MQVLARVGVRAPRTGGERGAGPQRGAADRGGGRRQPRGRAHGGARGRSRVPRRSGMQRRHHGSGGAIHGGHHRHGNDFYGHSNYSFGGTDASTNGCGGLSGESGGLSGESGGSIAEGAGADPRGAGGRAESASRSGARRPEGGAAAAAGGEAGTARRGAAREVPPPPPAGPGAGRARSAGTDGNPLFGHRGAGRARWQAEEARARRLRLGAHPPWRRLPTTPTEWGSDIDEALGGNGRWAARLRHCGELVEKAGGISHMEQRAGTGSAVYGGVFAGATYTAQRGSVTFVDSDAHGDAVHVAQEALVGRLRDKFMEAIPREALGFLRGLGDDVTALAAAPARVAAWVAERRSRLIVIGISCTPPNDLQPEGGTEPRATEEFFEKCILVVEAAQAAAHAEGKTLLVYAEGVPVWEPANARMRAMDNETQARRKAFHARMAAALGHEGRMELHDAARLSAGRQRRMVATRGFTLPEAPVVAGRSWSDVLDEGQRPQQVPGERGLPYDTLPYE